MNYAATVLAFILIYILLGEGLNLQLGYTGIFNFGYVAFFAIGAYTSALLTVHADVPLLIAWVAATLCAGIASIPLGLVSIRLGRDYLAIVTLGFSQVVGIFLLNERELTGGAGGVTGISRPFGALGEGVANAVGLVLLFAGVVAMTLILRRIAHSPLGRLLNGIRTSEAAAEAVGKDTLWYKTLAFVLGAGVAGLGGAMYAHWVQYISPDQFQPDVTFNVFMVLILGGVGTLGGPVVGSVVLIALLQGSLLLEPYVSFVSQAQLASLRFVAIGLVLLLFILYRPYGLLGSPTGTARTERRRRRRNRLLRWARASTLRSPRVETPEEVTGENGPAERENPT
jgi:branched-chain amino acid transport system permease protein